MCVSARNIHIIMRIVVEVTACAQVVELHLKKELVARTVFPLTAMTSSVSERFIKTQLKGVRNCKHFIVGILLTNATWKPKPNNRHHMLTAMCPFP